jgi:AraC-like DNA-binding protein
MPNLTCIKFLKLIDNQISHKHTVKEYARELNISNTQLNILLKKYLNTSASVLIKNRLAQEAKKDLLFTGGNISETAYKLGFSELSNFTRFFKKQTGLAPSTFVAMFPK